MSPRRESLKSSAEGGGNPDTPSHEASIATSAGGLLFQPVVSLRFPECDSIEVVRAEEGRDAGGIGPEWSDVEVDQVLGEFEGWRGRRLCERLTVGLDPRAGRDGRLCESARQKLDLHGIPAQGVQVQLPANALSSNPELLRTVSSIRSSGVGLVIGNFQPGRTKLDLSDWHAHSVKVDSKATQNFLKGERKTETLAMINEAHRLGLYVVATGVKTEEQARSLTRAQFDAAQGDGICPPLPAAELTSWLVSRQPPKPVF